ncbi:hypothetical protein TSAR_008128 [Trichomalopsis sarcophagae]|uniref:Uncharacterized protein n=1 Tax=Trichomalopsis sarcophagae TaxID=543379 RepID=A0A232EJU9_9HYME|nr:hypothetical protein TSAR_008128 [Trichomalopsis sarcophagae]
MSRANQRGPMRCLLSSRTGSQSEASKKRGPDDQERRASARTSGEIVAHRRFVRVTCVHLCLSTRGRRLEEIGQPVRHHHPKDPSSQQHRRGRAEAASCHQVREESTGSLKRGERVRTPPGPDGSWRLRLSHADVAGCSGPLDDGDELAGLLPLVRMVAGSSGRCHFLVPTMTVS